MAPALDLVGRVQLGAGIDPGQRAGATEVLRPDVEGEGGQGLELALGDGREQGRLHRLGGGRQVVEQQRLGVGAASLRALAGRAGVAVADAPAAARGRLRLVLEGLEARDQVDRGAGQARMQLHVIQFDPGGPSGSAARKMKAVGAILVNSA